MTYSETVLQELAEISQRDKVGLFEACVTYCEVHDLEPDELAEHLDGAAKQQLRQSALEENKIRKCILVPENALEFE